MPLKNIFERIKGESYWKERVVTGFMVTGYLIGNLVEMMSGKVTDDPAIIWIAGVIIGVLVIVCSLIPRYKVYTSPLFKFFLFYLNFNIIYAYSKSTQIPDDQGEFFYMLFSYILFVVISFALDNRRELIVYTVAEIALFAIAVYLNRDYNPMLLDSMQLFAFAVVLGGNFMINEQRMKYSQISSDVSIQFKVISENARDAQIIMDNQLRIVYINPAAGQLTGYKMSEIQRRSLKEITSAQDFEQISQIAEKLKTVKGSRERLEYRLKQADDSYIWVESIFSTFAAKENGGDELLFAETRNVEERKQQEEEIKQQMVVEEMLIRHSNQFINVDRAEIQSGIDVALGEFGRLLRADGVLVYRMHGKISDEFRSTNQWFDEKAGKLGHHFNLVVKIQHQLIVFLRSIRGEKSSRGHFILPEQLHEIQVINVTEVPGKSFYIIPLQSGNIVNGFVVFVFDQSVEQVPSNFFGLIGNMVANAFTRLRTEMRLHEAQLTNEFILRSLQDWLFIINKSGEFTGGNEFSTLPPYMPDFDLMGKKYADILPGQAGQLFNATLDEVVDNDIPAAFEYRDDTYHKGHYFKVIIAPFKANEYLLIIRDITDLKQAQSELEVKAKNLAQSNKELEEFAYIVSHDMKQPIRTIISYLSLLKKKHFEKLPADAQEFVTFSIDGANKMSDLIRDILQYSKLEQEIAMVPDVPLNDIVNKVLAGLRDTIEKNNATVVCDPLPAITCNQTMVTELFQNLIENGIKYNLSEKKVVTVKVEDKVSEWLFSISDNGIGFDQQYSEQIFKIFKRLHTDDEFQGTGIGLSICAKVVEKHGGKIWAVSEKGKGSTFHFTFPKAA
ncbi:MAG TPA: ATP-binding protein [Chitinophagales bacterium]|nr:ATP-binding protein [Chitinophagales bacterium]